MSAPARGHWVWAVNPRDPKTKVRPGIVCDARVGDTGTEIVIVFGQSSPSVDAPYLKIDPTPHYPLQDTTYFYARERACLPASVVRTTRFRLHRRDFAAFFAFLEANP